MANHTIMRLKALSEMELSAYFCGFLGGCSFCITTSLHAYQMTRLSEADDGMPRYKIAEINYNRFGLSAHLL